MQEGKDRFLGKETEYKFTYDNTLLVPIDREERRTEFKYPMVGGDIWTAFEVSFLGKNGLPEFHVLRFLNPADSTNIFESKSFKLYLNSFNNTKFESLEEVIKILKKDLKKLTKSSVKIKKITGFKKITPLIQKATVLEEVCSPVVEEYTYNKNLLSVFSSEENVTCSYLSNLLRSNCEITNQPDFSTIQIVYKTDKKNISEETLLKYIVSYRNHQEFHEPTCERIFQDLFTVLEPKELLVICQYTRRGGIDINPVRSSSEGWLKANMKNMFSLSKTIHQ